MFYITIQIQQTLIVLVNTKHSLSKLIFIKSYHFYLKYTWCVHKWTHNMRAVIQCGRNKIHNQPLIEFGQSTHYVSLYNITTGVSRGHLTIYWTVTSVSDLVTSLWTNKVMHLDVLIYVQIKEIYNNGNIIIIICTQFMFWTDIVLRYFTSIRRFFGRKFLKRESANNFFSKIILHVIE